MRYKTMVMWGLAASMMFGAVAPSYADKKNNNGIELKAKVRVVVQDGNDKEETRLYQQWYGNQMGQLNGTDPETGERYADIVQVVTEVTNDQLMVSDQQGLRRGVFVNAHTQVIMTLGRTQVNTVATGRKTTTRTAPQLVDMVRPGDMVIADGYLKVGGGMVATRIRVVGRARGYDYDDNDTYRPTYGFRSWGDIREINTRRGEFTLNANNGRVTIKLARDGEVLVNGQRQNLDFLRRGDRVVVYSRDKNSNVAYRIVILRDNDRYPDGDRPCMTDPDYKDRGTATGPMLEGRLQYISTGVFFNQIVIRTNAGREMTVRCGKTLEAIDRDGNRISLYNLRGDDQLWITYSDVVGTLFAEDIYVD